MKKTVAVLALALAPAIAIANEVHVVLDQRIASPYIAPAPRSRGLTLQLGLVGPKLKQAVRAHALGNVRVIASVPHHGQWRDHEIGFSTPDAAKIHHFEHSMPAARFYGLLRAHEFSKDEVRRHGVAFRIEAEKEDGQHLTIHLQNFGQNTLFEHGGD